MNWKEYYKQHLMSAEDAVNHIQSGNRVVVAHACGEPSYLLDVMVANAKAYKDVEIVHMVAMGKAEYCKPEYADNFRHNAFFVGGTSRDVMTKVMIPNSVPLLVSTMKVNIGLCLVGVIIGEFLAARAGLGYLIIYGSQVFKMDYVILSIVILCIGSALLYKIIGILERKFS